jgi:hypothetical protein
MLRCTRIQRVEVGADDTLVIGGRIFRDIRDGIHRSLAKLLVRLDIRELLARHIHREERVEVNVSINGDGMSLFGRDRFRLDSWSSLQADCGYEAADKRSLKEGAFTDFHALAVTLGLLLRRE